MIAVIVKYFEYDRLRFDPKFTLEATAAKLKILINLLYEQSNINAIYVMVPDQELFELSEQLLGLEKVVVRTLSSASQCEIAESQAPALFLDEQAFYLSPEIIRQVLDKARRSIAVGLEDASRFLWAYNYLAFCQVFVAPAASVLKNILNVSGFISLRDQTFAAIRPLLIPIEVLELRATYSRAVRLNPLPYHFVLEPTSRCDFQCLMCPFHSPDPRIAKGSVYIGQGGDDMPVSMLKRLVDEISELPWRYLPDHRVKTITLQLRGEPLLAPGFKEMCGYIKDKNLRLQFSTNGNNLGLDRNIPFFLEIGLDEIVVSIDGDPETFRHVRRNANYETILSNLRTLRQMRDAQGLKAPTIYTKTIILSNKPDLNYREIAKKFLCMADYVGFGFENYIDFQTDTKGYSSYFFQPEAMKPLPCISICDVAVVHANGNVQACYGDPLLSLGNVRNSSLSYVLSESRVRRQILAEQASSEIQHPACCSCTSWLAQHNRTRFDGVYQIQENPILSYWSLREGLRGKVEHQRRLRGLFARIFGKCSL